MSDQENSVMPSLYDCVFSESASPVPITSSKNQRPTKGKKRPEYKRRVKSPYSYIEMIGMAIKSSPSGRMTLRDILNFMYDRFQCFQGQYTGWKNSVRHNLSASDCFSKILRDNTRPYGKDNFWMLNKNCEHCKTNRENAAACKRIFATSKHNNNLPLNLIIRSKLLSRAISSGSARNDSSVCDIASENKTQQIVHPPLNSTSNYQYQYQDNYNSYYNQNYRAQHVPPRSYHRYHPYTTNLPYCTTQFPSTQPSYLAGDLAALEDLYIPPIDIDLSVYNDYEFGKDTKEYPLNLYGMMLPNVPQVYDNYQYYSTTNVSASCQYSPEHNETLVLLPPTSKTSESYVHPYPFDFVTTTTSSSSSGSITIISTEDPEFTSSSIRSSMSSASSESDAESTVSVPAESLAVVYENL